jgi:nucleoside-diphosphate-sugar epimerase
MNHATIPQSIVVTGSSGLIGTALVERFARTYHVFAVDRKGPTSALPPQVEYVQIDLTSEANVQKVLSTMQERCRGTIASVIHLAAYYDFSGEPSDLYEQVTVRGTERLLRALHGLAVEQFVFSSTMLVHRPTEPGQPIREDSPLEGRGDYPQSKIDTEQLIRAQHGSIPIVLLRIAGVYTDTCDSISMAHQIQRIYEKRLTGYVYPGDTSRGQAFVPLEDLVEALWC